MSNYNIRVCKCAFRPESFCAAISYFIVDNKVILKKMKPRRYNIQWEYGGSIIIMKMEKGNGIFSQ